MTSFHWVVAEHICDFGTRVEFLRTVRRVMPWERAPICITVPSECSICKSSQQPVQIRQYVQFYSLYSCSFGRDLCLDKWSWGKFKSSLTKMPLCYRVCESAFYNRKSGSWLREIWFHETLKSTEKKKKLGKKNLKEKLVLSMKINIFQMVWHPPLIFLVGFHRQEVLDAVLPLFTQKCHQCTVISCMDHMLRIHA